MGASVGIIMEKRDCSLFANALVMEETRMKNIVLAAMLLITGGCATKPESISSFTPAIVPEGKAVVYIYKAKTYGKAIWGIEANGEPITIISRANYFPYIVGPGEIQLVSKMMPRIGNLIFAHIEPKNRKTINVKSGERRYIRIAGALNPEFAEAPEEEALEELKKCSLVGPYIADDM